MDKKVLDYVVEKSHELMNAPTCSKETKEAAEAWLNAVGTESEGGAQVFGADKAKDVAAHAREIKSAGAAYCDCPACVVVAEILEKKDMLL